MTESPAVVAKRISGLPKIAIGHWQTAITLWFHELRGIYTVRGVSDDMREMGWRQEAINQNDYVQGMGWTHETINQNDRTICQNLEKLCFIMCPFAKSPSLEIQESLQAVRDTLEGSRDRVPNLADALRLIPHAVTERWGAVETEYWRAEMKQLQSSWRQLHERVKKFIKTLKDEPGDGSKEAEYSSLEYLVDPIGRS